MVSVSGVDMPPRPYFAEVFMLSLASMLLSRAFSESAGGTAPMILRPYMVGVVRDTSDVEVEVDVPDEPVVHDIDDGMEVMAPPAIKREPGTEGSRQQAAAGRGG
jgi:hypothetical protein